MNTSNSFFEKIVDSFTGGFRKNHQVIQYLRSTGKQVTLLKKSVKMIAAALTRNTQKLEVTDSILKDNERRIALLERHVAQLSKTTSPPSPPPTKKDFDVNVIEQTESFEIEGISTDPTVVSAVK